MASSVWNNGMYVRAYELAREGYADPEIAQMFGISALTIADWKRKDSHFADAIKKGRGNGGDQGRFADYVFNRLPTHLQELWDRIDECEKVRNGVRKIEALLSNAGKTARQHLFLYALVRNCFNTSDACSKVLISLKELEDWKNNDPQFAELVEEIHQHKQNWCEGALFRGVAADNPQLIMYANSALNADKGYGQKNVNVTKQVTSQHEHRHVHAVVATEKIMEALDTQGKVKLMQALLAIKAKRAENEQKETQQRGTQGQARSLLPGPVDSGVRVHDLQPEGGRGAGVDEERQEVHTDSGNQPNSGGTSESDVRK